ncbi:MAG: tryptophan-rich sensory protein [[Clostridium] spiroforme]|nr:tryptophan-rich sensory protein [Thomasclavelia spiroformis]
MVVRGNFLKIQWKTLIICLLIPLAVGIISAFLTRNNMETFDLINKPFLAPPSWLFPVVWTILYILMGIASYLVFISEKPNKTALTVYGLQLIFNFFWSIIFFNLELYLFAFIWLVLLWLLVIKTTILFYQISKPAGYLMIPYLLWVTFAGYLNFSIYLLN